MSVNFKRKIAACLYGNFLPETEWFWLKAHCLLATIVSCSSPFFFERAKTVFDERSGANVKTESEIGERRFFHLTRPVGF